MYGARDYLAYLGYGAMRLFQNEIIWGHGNFWSRKKNCGSHIAINVGRSLTKQLNIKNATLEGKKQRVAKSNYQNEVISKGVEKGWSEFCCTRISFT